MLNTSTSIALFGFVTVVAIVAVACADPMVAALGNLAGMGGNLGKQQAAKLPPCKLCTTLTDSFGLGLERTARGKHDGGDAAWEEKKLGSYKRSEIRLVEIQERLCKEVSRGEDQCHALAETSEHLLEEWWSKKQSDDKDAVDEKAALHQWLCVEQLKVCCAPNTYGPRCEPCTDCRGNGKCKGAGTRKGNGKCACDTGYRGDDCRECDGHFYESFRDETKLLCSACHVACGGGGDGAGCTGAGPKGCRVCKDGWLMKPELGGCVDVDECAVGGHRCTVNQFCVNNEGSHSCLECDRSCRGCTGDGPDECSECAAGFELRDGLCKDLTNERNEQWATLMRYFTYFGLCVATCVIFKNSVYAASAIGLAVGVYISLAEYYLYMNPAKSTAGGGGGGAVNVGPNGMDLGPIEDLIAASQP